MSAPPNSSGDDPADEPSSEEERSRAPWETRPEWRDPRIPDRKPSTQQRKSAIVAALIWAMAGFLWWYGGEMLALGWAVFGLFYTWWAVRPLVESRRRSDAVFRMDAMPGRLGEPLTGTVLLDQRSGMPADPSFRVYLSCYERFESGGGPQEGPPILTKNPQWRAEREVPGRPGDEEHQIAVPVSLEIPEDQAPSTLEQTMPRTMWAVEIEGVGFEAYHLFEIPVLPPEEGSPGDRASPYAEASKRGGPAEPIPDLGDQLEVKTRPGGDPEIRFQGCPDLTAGLVAGITGLLFVPIGTALAVIGLVFSLLGLFGLVLIGVGALCLYNAWLKRLSATTITVEDGHIRAERSAPGPLPNGSAIRFPADDVIDVRVTTSPSPEGRRPGSAACGVQLLYRYRGGTPGASSSRWIRRMDLESARQHRLSLPEEDEDLTIGVVPIATNLPHQEKAETIAHVVRKAITRAHDPSSGGHE